MNYTNMDFNSVKGYGKLSDYAKKVFESTYRLHHNSLGKDEKEGYVPVKVAEAKDHLKVTFKNGEWLHYLPNMTWY